MEGGPELKQTPDESPQDYWPENEDPKLEPRIYVADLLAYNWGELRGVWLDAAQDPEELQEQIDAMLAGCKYGKAEEWAIHDFEGFNGLHLGEWEDLAHVSKIAKGIEQHGEAYAHWATLVTEDEELDQFEQHYLGRWPSQGAMPLTCSMIWGSTSRSS